MNRTIKFRAFDDGKMIYPENIQHLSLEDYEVLRLAKFFCNVRNDSKIMQFTGLIDKNGKEIYEGDILNGWRKGSNSDREYTGVIEWQQQQAGWIIKCGKFVMEILSLAMSGDGVNTQLDSFEVIGNIYETPELLATPPQTVNN